MKNSTRKAVILDNLTSPYVYQAILILKSSENVSEGRLLSEAERIVSDYFCKKNNGNEDIILYSRSQKSSKKSFAAAIGISAGLLLLLICAAAFIL